MTVDIKMSVPEAQDTLWSYRIHQTLIQSQVGSPLHWEELYTLTRLFLELWEALGEDM